MSTKITLDYEMSDRILNHGRKGKKVKPKSEQFHAYLECFDKDKQAGTVYLELHDVYFDASPGMVTVAVPPRVWNRLMKIGPIPVKRGKVQRFDLPVPPRIED